MIKKVILCVLAIAPFVAMAQQDFSVKGEVGKINSPAKVFLIYNNEGQRIIDSAEINAGVFNFKGSVNEPEQAILVLDHEGVGLQAIVTPDMTQFFLEKGNILINAKDSLSNAVLSGTSLNMDQQKLNVLLKETNKSLESIIAVYTNATEEEQASEDFVNRVKGEFDVVAQKSKALRFEFIKENPNSFVSLMALLESASLVSDPKELLPLLTALSPELQQNSQAKSFAQQLEMAINSSAEVGVPQVGAMAPEFTQNDTTGTPVSLASFRGKYVLLDFWASWCGPCRQENPNLVAAFNKYKDKNFTILGVSLDRPNGRENWLKAISDDKLAWTQVSDLKFWENEVARQYGIRSIPQSYLIDPEGRIVAANLRGAALHEKLAELLD